MFLCLSVHTFASYWQMPCLNQRNWENDRCNYFTINPQESYVASWARTSDPFRMHRKQPLRFGWLCWGLTSQSTIFQSCRDGAIASWVINQYFRGVKCLAQGHNTAAVGLEPRTSRSGVRHSTTEPPRSPDSPCKPSSKNCCCCCVSVLRPFDTFQVISGAVR